jgi:hypothetical protein
MSLYEVSNVDRPDWDDEDRDIEWVAVAAVAWKDL